MSHRTFSLSKVTAYSLACLFLGSPIWAQDGEQLAKSWCSSCHLFPEPALLDKSTWIDYVLPDMGLRLGFQAFRGQIHNPNPNAPTGVYADEPLMETSEWEQIVSWYENNAPDQITTPNWQQRSKLDLFEIELPEVRELDFPTSTAIFIDKTSHRLLLGDSYALNFEIYSDTLEILNVIQSGGAISRVAAMPDNTYLMATMGGNVGQTEVPLGLLIEVDEDSEEPSAISRLVQRLHRPVDFVAGDFNNDGKTDYVIAEFGAYAGKLSLHLSQNDGTLRETILLDEAGATSLAVVGEDLLALVAQGNERIIRIKDFTTDQPITETIHRFPPSQGSSNMKVLDFNGDGLSDLLYTAGDNADISPIYKPYHGIYLFTGQLDKTFQLEMFFHFDGAYGAVAEDFDQDGDKDIVAISYFPNIDKGLDQTTLVYLQNNNGSFAAMSVDGIGDLGRFVAITAGDIDGDGDQDIAIANMAFGPYGPLTVGPELRDQWLSGTGFVLLRNTLH